MRMPYPPNYKYSNKEDKLINIEVNAWIIMLLFFILLFIRLPFYLYG